jgi:3-phenylpropionate/cinnamic acid dioxygenase small subunit
MTDPLEFVVAEAALLDGGRFDDWLALFAPDGHYWVPLLGAAQIDPFSHNSIAFDDRLLLQLRVDRLKNPRAHSQHPKSACQHVLQRPVVESDDPATGEITLRTPFIYIEARGDDQVLLTGSCRHRLVRGPDGLLIRQKRVDLLNPQRALPAIQLFV